MSRPAEVPILTGKGDPSSTTPTETTPTGVDWVHDRGATIRIIPAVSPYPENSLEVEYRELAADDLRDD